MDAEPTPAAQDLEALKAALARAQTELAEASAQRSDDQALIAHLKLELAKLNRQRYGAHAERTGRLLDQMELQLEELEASATEDEIAAEAAAAETTTVAAFTRRRPARKPFPEHLPRERVLVPGSGVCLFCGGTRLSKLGEDVTETLEVVPRSSKVIQHVREKFKYADHLPLYRQAQIYARRGSPWTARPWPTGPAAPPGCSSPCTPGCWND